METVEGTGIISTQHSSCQTVPRKWHEMHGQMGAWSDN